MSIQNYLLLLLFAGVCFPVSGQTGNRFREKTDSFNVRQVQQLAARKTYLTLVDLFSVTNCKLLDMDKTRNGFIPNAYIEVTTTRTNRIKQYPLESFISHVWGLVCDPNSIYRQANYRLREPFAREVQVFIEGDTCKAVVPILEIFDGKAFERWRNYSDITLRHAVILFYHEDGILKSKIHHIEADRPQPYNGQKIF